MVASASRPRPDGARPKDLVSIQYLRGMAAGAVLVFHACQKANLDAGVGAAGVDLFFVISGFIMWVVSQARPLTPGQFVMRRIERIVPLYWLVTLGAAAIAVLAPFVFPNMTASFGHVLGSIFFVPHRDATGEIYPLIVPGWSLNYEMFFYAVFALGLALPVRFRLAWLAGTLISFVAAGRLVGSASPLWITYTNPLLLEFLAGVFLGAAYTRGARLPAPVSLALLAAGVAGYAATPIFGLHIEGWRIVEWGLPAFAIVTGAVLLERAGKVGYFRAPHFVGDASYSLYLVHGFAVSAAFRVGEKMHLPLYGTVVLAVVAGLCAGMATYKLVEQPLLKLVKYRASRGVAARAAALAPAP